MQKFLIRFLQIHAGKLKLNVSFQFQIEKNCSNLVKANFNTYICVYSSLSFKYGDTLPPLTLEKFAFQGVSELYVNFGVTHFCISSVVITMVDTM